MGRLTETLALLTAEPKREYPNMMKKRNEEYFFFSYIDASEIKKLRQKLKLYK